MKNTVILRTCGPNYRRKFIYVLALYTLASNTATPSMSEATNNNLTHINGGTNVLNIPRSI